MEGLVEDLKGSIAISKKDLKEYYLKPPTISWGIVFPIMFALSFLIRGRDPHWLAPGLLALSLFFASTSMSAASIVFERRLQSFERLLLFPISYTGIAFGKTLSSFLFGVLASTITLAVILSLTSLSIPHPLLLALSILLASLQSSSFGVLLAFAVKDPTQSMVVFNSIRLPMIFLCNIIIPVSRLPWYIKPISLMLPLTYSVDAVRYALTDTYDLVPPIPALGIIAASFLAFLCLTSYLIRRSIP